MSDENARKFVHVHDQLALCTCRIVTTSPSGGSGSGTGFFVTAPNWAAVFTNKHVVRGAVTISMLIDTELKDGGERRRETLNFATSDPLIWHPDPEVDLVALPMSNFVDAATRTGRQIIYRAFRREDLPTPEMMLTMTAVENILMVGYPIGLWDSHNNRPIIRRGITATAYTLNYDGKQQFLIDAACFPGSSGSPVVLFETSSLGNDGIHHFGHSRFALLGALWGGPQFALEGELVPLPIPTAVTHVPFSRIPTNLGYCVNATAIAQLMDAIQATVDSAIATEKLLQTKPQFT